MNIFYLHEDQSTCAKMHCDKHVVKMAVEYAQLLSTCHRVMDGEKYYDKTSIGRRIQRWKLNNEDYEESLYKASHVNHPCNIWIRESSQHYRWLWSMWVYLCHEYTIRYGKIHKASDLRGYLFDKPNSLRDNGWTDPPQCMPDALKVKGDTIKAYRNYYQVEKSKFATWLTEEPIWYNKRNDYAVNISEM